MAAHTGALASLGAITAGGPQASTLGSSPPRLGNDPEHRTFPYASVQLILCLGAKGPDSCRAFSVSWIGPAGGPMENGDGCFRLFDHLRVRPARQRLFS